MSDMGVITTNLHCASKLLRPYIVALGDIRSRGGSTEQPDEVQSLLAVLVPMSLHLRGRSYFKLGINGEKMSEFLRLRHREDWPRVRDGILAVTARLEKNGGSKVDLSREDLSILGGVAGALDNECSFLFRKTRRR